MTCPSMSASSSSPKPPHSGGNRKKKITKSHSISSFNSCVITRSLSCAENGSTAGNEREKEIKKLALYKTELCRSFEETGHCRYGHKCQFAHGYAELRPVRRHPKYKTTICRTFWEQGSCPYGKRCCFIHNEHVSTDLPLTAPSSSATNGSPGNATCATSKLRILSKRASFTANASSTPASTPTRPLSLFAPPLSGRALNGRTLMPSRSHPVLGNSSTQNTVWSSPSHTSFIHPFCWTYPTPTRDESNYRTTETSHTCPSAPSHNTAVKSSSPEVSENDSWDEYSGRSGIASSSTVILEPELGTRESPDLEVGQSLLGPLMQDLQLNEDLTPEQLTSSESHSEWSPTSNVSAALFSTAAPPVITEAEDTSHLDTWGSSTPTVQQLPSNAASRLMWSYNSQQQSHPQQPLLPFATSQSSYWLPKMAPIIFSANAVVSPSRPASPHMESPYRLK